MDDYASRINDNPFSRLLTFYTWHQYSIRALLLLLYLVEERLRDVTDVPIGAACGDDHVVGAGPAVQTALADGEYAHVTRSYVAQYLLHLRELQQRPHLWSRGRCTKGGGKDAWEEVRRRAPPAKGTASHGEYELFTWFIHALCT